VTGLLQSSGLLAAAPCAEVVLKKVEDNGVTSGRNAVKTKSYEDKYTDELPKRQIQ
jgi:hypothetical protein